MATYEARRSLYEASSTFELAGGALTRSETGAVKQQAALADVRRVRLSYVGQTIVPSWACAIEAPRMDAS